MQYSNITGCGLYTYHSRPKRSTEFREAGDGSIDPAVKLCAKEGGKAAPQISPIAQDFAVIDPGNQWNLWRSSKASLICTHDSSEGLAMRGF
jgi:hypothetical protein